MAKSKSSRQWLNRHVNDAYVHRAKAQGYRSRAAFKLLEIDDRDRILRPGARVVDLGGAPGGWSQVAAARCTAGRVVAIDLLPIAPISGVMLIEGDFLSEEARVQLAAAIGERVDVVLSDLSPNLSGIAVRDQAQMAELVEEAAVFARSVLAPNGVFLAKVFHGAAFEQVRSELRKGFVSVAVRKPLASRGESSETYLLARGPKPLRETGERR